MVGVSYDCLVIIVHLRIPPRDCFVDFRLFVRFYSSAENNLSTFPRSRQETEGSFGSFAIRPAMSQDVCHSWEMSRTHEARSCRVTCVLPLPAHWTTAHEPLAVSRRCPSRPGLHLGVRTRSQRRGMTASVHRHRPSRRPHRPSLAEPSRTAPLDNR